MVGILRNDSDALAFVSDASSEPMRTTAVSAYELLKGAAISSRHRENLALVGELLGSLSVLPLDQDSSDLASSVYSKARNAKLTICEFDILIAAIAMQNDETLITRDRHFQGLKDLRLRTW